MGEFLPAFVSQLQKNKWTLAPIIINPRGRVALGDQINDYLKAKFIVMLIGERPGLTTPDSLGIYFTYHAHTGCTDEQRNCISNIHSQGLLHEAAAKKLMTLLQKANKIGMTGVGLKDDAS